MKKLNNKGFTLVEMLIVMGLIAILAAIAIPSYSNFIIRANRAEGMDLLTEIMNQQQRFSTRNRTYTDDLTDLGYAADPVNTENTRYQIAADACQGTVIVRCIVLTATPQGAQAVDGEGNITLNSRGQKTLNGFDNWNQR